MMKTGSDGLLEGIEWDKSVLQIAGAFGRMEEMLEASV